eukprot:7391087-Prymnesium_polylepis.2
MFCESILVLGQLYWRHDTSDVAVGLALGLARPRVRVCDFFTLLAEVIHVPWQLSGAQPAFLPRGNGPTRPSTTLPPLAEFEEIRLGKKHPRTVSPSRDLCWASRRSAGGRASPPGGGILHASGLPSLAQGQSDVAARFESSSACQHAGTRAVGSTGACARKRARCQHVASQQNTAAARRASQRLPPLCTCSRRPPASDRHARAGFAHSADWLAEQSKYSPDTRPTPVAERRACARAARMRGRWCGRRPDDRLDT